MKNMKLGTKIMGITIILLLLMIISSFYSIMKFVHMGKEIQAIAEIYIPLSEFINEVRVDYLEQNHWLERAMRFSSRIKDNDENKNAVKNFQESVQEFNNNTLLIKDKIKKGLFLAEKAMQTSHETFLIEDFRKIIEHFGLIEKQHALYTKEINQVFDLLKKDMLEQAEHAAEQLEINEKKFSTELNTFAEHIEELAVKSAIDAEQDEKKALNIIIIITCMSIAAGLIMSLLLTKKITKSLDQVIQGLAEGSEHIVSAANQVSSSSQTLAQGASHQAASVEETSSSLEELTSMTRQNTSNAKQVKNSQTQAYASLQTASQSMDETGEAMESIKARGEEIGNIIKSIDEIAFQTNLLALNAAVEAARAGTAGAGFAVVAEEVRNLALRAGDASKNTQNLIQKTVDEIRSGSDLVEKTRQAFDITVHHNKKVAELIDEIASASEQQSQGIEQIGRAVSIMEDITQQNAATAQESASASEELNAQAEQLKALADELVCTGGRGVCEADVKDF
ncbi:Methyl-accepting chemotaxis protein signailing-domain-containing protein [Desulfonema limicola]|uniref:Methyl-accepting chemotaxis protein signailing-domain-containing protein n=1 Tax=Desulfonema limicola TaxID=45656 RepID=A0A975BBD2_9BACT|nr:methyl-accepting chemotaxis protein [Desulfonema limicola]QTA82100.1 Methyl-accepting chemotaxis protein signailing-domain-containing protein [Desulfonema limicola]